MASVDDIELWRRAAEGNRDAFATLFDRHASAVYTYCFRRTADWALAEDMTSVVFLEAWRRRHEIEPRTASALPLLLGVATNVIRNEHRSLRRYRIALARLPPLEPDRDFADDVTDRLDDARHMRALLRTLRELPVPEQEAIALCVWQRLTSAEAAEALGIPDTTVRTRLSRGLARLRGSAVDATERVNAG